MNSDPELREVGCDLVKHAEFEAVFSAQRGIVDELFPYIYVASKRMSTRAISRWLMATQKIKLSAATIAKALREADKYWEEYFETIEPAAQIFARAHNIPIADFLFDLNEFGSLRTREKDLRFSGDEGYNEYQEAAETLEQDWFQLLDDEAREKCKAFVPDESEEHEEKTEVEHERGKRK